MSPNVRLKEWMTSRVHLSSTLQPTRIAPKVVDIACPQQRLPQYLTWSESSRCCIA